MPSPISHRGAFTGTGPGRGQSLNVGVTTSSGDLAAEVLEGERGLFDEGARFVSAAEHVRAGTNGLDPRRADWIDVALDDELVAEPQAPQRDDLPAVLARGAGEVVVDGSAAATRRLRGFLRHAHSPAFRAAWRTICLSAKPERRTT